MTQEPTEGELAAALTSKDDVIGVVVRLFEDAAETAEGLWMVESAVGALLRRATDAGVTQDAPGLLLLQAAHDAITYRLAFDDGRCSFEPYLDLPDGTTQPPRATAQPADVVERWKMLHVTTTHPIWRSRFGHLLAATADLTGRERVEVAASAVKDYIAYPAGWRPGLDYVDALRAALSLAKQFGLRELREAVLDATVEAARSALAGDPDKAGIVLRLTQILVDERDAPAAVDALLDSARTAYSGDVHRTNDVIEQQLRRAAGDAARRAELWRERVQAWLDAADACGDIRRAKFLETAVEYASRSGDRGLRQAATARLQELTLDDLQLQGVASGMILRGEDIALAVRTITEAPTWTEALDAFATFGPPTGDVTENRRIVEEHAREFVFSKLFPVTQYGSDGLPRFSATSDEERAEYDLAQHETFNLQFQRRLVAEALLRFPNHHPLPTYQELTAYFARNPIVTAPLAAALARSFLRWWAGDYEGAAFTVAPRIESLARNLLLAVNAPLYRLQRDRAPGQYPGLGFLLEQLRQVGFPESWYRYLFTFLANPAGWNVRNELAHGFFDHIDLVASALLLQCAANLALAAPSGSPATDASQGADLDD